MVPHLFLVTLMRVCGISHAWLLKSPLGKAHGNYHRVERMLPYAKYHVSEVATRWYCTMDTKSIHAVHWAWNQCYSTVINIINRT